MKTFDKKDVFTLVTAEEAIACIGKRGYFGDSFEELESNINKDCGDNLREVFPDRYTSVVFRPYANEACYGLFIPTDKVKEVEEPKKYRPFKSTDEFLKFYKVGQVIHLKNKNNNLEQLTSIVAVLINCFCCVCLGINNNALPFEDLLKKYEIKIDSKWQPFGVEE